MNHIYIYIDKTLKIKNDCGRYKLINLRQLKTQLLALQKSLPYRLKNRSVRPTYAYALLNHATLAIHMSIKVSTIQHKNYLVCLMTYISS